MSTLVVAMTLSLALVVAHALLTARAQAQVAELERTSARLRRYLR